MINFKVFMRRGVVVRWSFADSLVLNVLFFFSIGIRGQPHLEKYIVLRSAYLRSTGRYDISACCPYPYISTSSYRHHNRPPLSLPETQASSAIIYLHESPILARMSPYQGATCGNVRSPTTPSKSKSLRPHQHPSEASRS
ncbi:unnamed protein product [Periconia digitata]|uniref:Uncharacterized protein n=1 Tax=Periconia digitata TaxID=1303443 RepID=A0A9W4XLH7_9PLEO|nr:unnamed protein product [Periconia digitata]